MSQDYIRRDLWTQGALCLSFTLVLMGCSPSASRQEPPTASGFTARPLPARVPPQNSSRDWEPINEQRENPPLSSSTPSIVTLAAGVKRVNSRGVALTFLLFDDREYKIAVADKERGPATEWLTAQAAAISHGAVASINGGFFTPEGEPLGLVIENGKRIGSWNSQSSLASGLLSVEKFPRLLRRQYWRSFSPTRHLLQTGPFLVENNVEVRDLNDREARPRSFIAWNGRHRWAFGFAEGATLAGLGSALAAQPLSEINITTAINLDGGRSSDLWVSPEIPGGGLSTRKIWNSPVRNYLLLLPGRP